MKAKEIGVITHYFGKISVGIIKLKAKLDLGDRIEIKGAHVDFSQPVKSMQINHKNVTSARKGAEVGVKVKKRVHLNDKVYKKTS
ncbi:MAG: translation elongation factor-like protein [Candidatus Omnitrophica bacterium]|nr:translation elongation factor-like protein [Candidatus Omnitrophota bacterium]